MVCPQSVARSVLVSLLVAAHVGADTRAVEAQPATCLGRTANIVGTQGADTLYGNDGNDVIAGLGGNDTIHGLAGNDVICGGDGNDTLSEDPGPVLRRPYLVALEVDGGAPTDWDAQPDGPVLALAVSPDHKRLYVGGSFSHIGGKAIRRLAAVDLDTGRWDPTFNPPTPNAYVRAMALHGDRLYIGGAFSQLGTVDRPQLAALDAVTGALHEDWEPPPNGGGRFVGQTGTPTRGPDPGNVADLQVTADGSMVIVGGSFLDLGRRSGLIVLDSRTGDATPWQPDMDRPRPVFGLDIWPVDGRTFFTAAGGLGGAVAAFSPGGDTKPQWLRTVDGDGIDIAATDERVYVVGHFDFALPAGVVRPEGC